MKKPKSRARWWLLVLLLPLAAFLIYQVPFVNQRLSWRFADLKTRLTYLIRPPDQAVFVPAGETPLATPSLQPVLETPEPTPELSPTASPTPGQGVPATPLPDSVILEGVVYVDQHERWNYCGPANLTMALNFWGWPGNRDDVARVVKPGINDPDLDFIQQGRHDKNVMPSELIDFVVEETDFNIVARYGADLELVKSFIARGFPVLVEKGYYEPDYTGKVAWMGHYLFTTGYDEAAGEFVVQDAYLIPGQNRRVDYATYLEGWRSFDYLLMVVYPPDRQGEVMQILGPWADPAWGYQRALEIAEEEIGTLSGVDLFFAWFNKGTSLVKLERYQEAGAAFDQAYQIYNGLAGDETTRPYRITWYQTTPYMAYFYSGRYQDVINLANTTLYDTISEPTLEESIYWRGMAYLALGETGNAVEDFRQTVYLNPSFLPGISMLQQLGVEP